MTGSGNHNLLFGVLALRLDFITQEQFVEGVKAWLRHRERFLGDILVERGLLSATTPRMLAPIVELHLARHGGDAARSLAALSTVAPVQQALSAIGDLDIPTTPASAYMPETLTDPDATAAQEKGRDTIRLADMGESDGSSAPQNQTRYRIEHSHARGGLGEVFVALDLELNRKVALKQIRDQHADDPVSRSQFLVEGEITGGLEHPGIIPVYGLGHYDNGRPYYAMRFVEGDTLLAAIERFHQAGQSKSTSERNLAFRELLRRFLDVCQAIAYAHQRGVLHRDLKPSNVLLGEFGETLVIDWGLAKVLGKSNDAPAESASHQPVSTSHEALETVGRGIHGTPGYMSPEQASGDIEALGPATDIYSLGAILFHLLTNRPPLTQKDGNILERTIKGDIPTARQVKPDAPAGLEAVCLKAMALRPGARYASVQRMREDVDHWLADEPVSAWREPFGVKTRRWIRKHPRKVAALTATVLMGMMAVGFGALLLGEKNRELSKALSGERRERQRADDRFTIALDAFKQQVFDAEQLLVDRPGMQDLRKAMMKRAVEGLEKLVKEAEKTEGADRVRAWAHFILGDVSLSLDGQVERGRQEYQKAFELCERLADPNDPQSQRDLSIAHDKLGNALYRLGKLQPALEHYQESMRIAQGLVDVDGDDKVRQRDLSIAHDQIGDIHLRQGQVQKSLEHYQQSMTIRKRLLDPRDARSQRDLARSFDAIGDIHYRQDRLDQALEHYQESMKIRKELADPKSGVSQRELSYSHDKFGHVFLRRGKPVRALEHYQESLRLCKLQAEVDPTDIRAQHYLSIAHSQIGDALLRQDKLDQALAAYRESMSIAKLLAEKDLSDTATQRSLSIAYDKLGDVLLKQGELKKALEPYRESLQIAKGLAEKDQKDAQSLRDLSLAYDQIGRVQFRLQAFDKALEQYQEQLKILKDLASVNDGDVLSQRDLAKGFERVGETLLNQGEKAKAAEPFEEALTIRTRLANPTDSNAQRDLSIAHDRLGLMYLDQGEHTKAMEHYETSMQIAKQLAHAAPEDAMLQGDLAIAYRQIGDVHFKQQEDRKALEQYEKSYRIHKQLADHDPSNFAAQWDVYLNLDLLAEVAGHRGEPAQAIEWYEKAVAVLRALDKAGKVKDPRHVKSMERTEANLRECRAAEKALGPLDMLLKLPESEVVNLLLVRADWLMLQRKHTEAAAAADKLAALAKDGPSFFAAASAYAWCTRDRANEARHAMRCFELLRKARDGGTFKDMEKVKALRSEPFKVLLGRQEFKQFLAELEMKRD
jgi:serine/threonine-protein kinase